MWNPEICQDAPSQGQDDLVLLSSKNSFYCILGPNQLLLTKGSYVQDLVDVFVNYEREVNRGKITIKITGALLYIFQHLVGSSKEFKLFQLAFPFNSVSDLKACLAGLLSRSGMKL